MYNFPYRYLSTFRVCRFGEARAYSRHNIINFHSRLKKSQLFEPLMGNLAKYNSWLPGFTLMDGPVNSVHVIFRVLSDATVEHLPDLQDRQKYLAREWWMTILMPALRSLPEDTKTRILMCLPQHRQREFSPPTSAFTPKILPYWTVPYTMPQQNVPSIHSYHGSSSARSTARGWK